MLGPSQGRLNETLIGLTLTLYPGVKFDPSNKVHFTLNGQLVTDADYDRGGSRDRDCPIGHTKCLIIDLTNPGLPQLQDQQGARGAHAPDRISRRHDDRVHRCLLRGRPLGPEEPHREPAPREQIRGDLTVFVDDAATAVKLPSWFQPNETPATVL